ncbi:hypothetical protein [Bacillus rubiinfantis]|nr:hypothetical protein [Bacillus rubiinfantis]
MGETCFYCANEVEDQKRHVVSFTTSNQDREETLCRDCYQEWLQGIKG